MPQWATSVQSPRSTEASANFAVFPKVSSRGLRYGNFTDVNSGESDGKCDNPPGRFQLY